MCPLKSPTLRDKADKQIRGVTIHFAPDRSREDLERRNGAGIGRHFRFTFCRQLPADSVSVRTTKKESTFYFDQIDENESTALSQPSTIVFGELGLRRSSEITCRLTSHFGSVGQLIESQPVGPAAM
jgi:hypothetical protein